MCCVFDVFVLFLDTSWWTCVFIKVSGLGDYCTICSTTLINWEITAQTLLEEMLLVRDGFTEAPWTNKIAIRIQCTSSWPMLTCFVGFGRIRNTFDDMARRKGFWGKTQTPPISFATGSLRRPSCSLNCLRPSGAICLEAVGTHGQHTGDLSRAATSTGAISPWPGRGGKQVGWVERRMVDVGKKRTNQTRSSHSESRFCRKVSKGHRDGLGRGRHRVNGGSRCGLCQISILGQGSLGSRLFRCAFLS